MEDNCESMCATFNDKYCGTFGMMGTHSLFFAPHANNGRWSNFDRQFEVYNFLKSLRAHGWTRDLDKKSKLYKRNSKYFMTNLHLLLWVLC